VPPDKDGSISTMGRSLLCDFFFHDFALTRLENSHHSAHLGDNFQFNVIGHK